MATKVCGIYMVINNFTGEQYIGQSTNVLKRFSNHQYESKHPKRRFHKDIQKYGINNFALIVLKESLPEELDVVKPGGTGTPIRFISARLAPLPPSASRICALPSACPLPKV